VSIANDDADENPFNFTLTAAVSAPPVANDHGCTPGSGSPAWVAMLGFLLAAWRARKIGRGRDGNED
jgi:MYXO-CTERM domain-containing protein